MAKKGEAKVIFNAEVSSFTDGIKQINKSLGNLKSDLKVANAELKANGESFEALSDKQKILKKITEENAEKVELLQKKLTSCKKHLGENSNEYQRLYKQLNNAKSEQIRFTSELKDTEKALEQADSKTNLFTKTLDKMKDKLGDIKDISIGTAIGNMASNIADGIMDMGAEVLDLTDNTQEFNSLMGNISASCKQFGFDIDISKDKVKELYGLFGDEQMAVNAVTNIQAMGLSVQTTNGLLDACANSALAFGDSLPIESLTESVNETIKVGQVTGNLADAINWTTGEEEAFNNALSKCTTEQERASLVTDLLNDKYGKAGKTWREDNESLINYRDSVFNLQTAQANLGEALAPLNTEFNKLKTTLANNLAPVLQEHLPNAIQTAKGAFQKLQDAFQTVKDGLQSVGEFITQHQTLFTTLGIAVGGLTAALIAYNGANILAAASSALMTAQTAIYCAGCSIASVATTAFGVAVNFLTSPITLVILAVTALIAIIVALVKNWDTVKNALTTGWEWLKNQAVRIFTAIGTTITNIWNNIKTWTVNTWNSIKTAISDTVSSVASSISDKFNVIKSTITSIWNGIKSFFSTVWSGIKDTVSNGITSITSKFSQMKTLIGDAMSGVLSAITKPFTSAWKTISGIWSKIKGVISSITGAKVSTSSFSGGSGGHASEHATGGIFTKPTLMRSNLGFNHIVGEAGAEAILPLDSFYQHLDNVIANSSTEIDYQRLKEDMYNAFHSAMSSLNLTVEMDSTKVAKCIASDLDKVNGSRQKLYERGMSL